MSYWGSETVQHEPATRAAGATFGPWADHDQRCKCNVCR